ncbi:glycosyltransferase [Proteus mirabilis]|uniref:glycosyltransferase n=3 Tax=Proteus mirabilis TaxID=584 RepID=UPI0023F9C409|nr:glycosyltransferase [Proteus mirabilis]MDF7327373.1 glycosyltransferase [Proteus mirabilis]
MKIIHIIDSFRIGGVEIGILSLLNSNKDYKVITVNGCDIELYNSLSKDQRKKIIIFNSYYYALRYLIKEKPNIVISSLWRSHILTLIYGLFNKHFKKIHFVHNSRFSHKVDKFITFLSLKRAHVVFFDSIGSKLWINKYKIIKDIQTKVIPMNISFSKKKRYFKPNDLSFVYTGRISEVKRIDLANLFIAELINMGLNPKFHIFGPDSGSYQKIKDNIKDLNLEKNVFLHEKINPLLIEEKLRNYNFYLQTSEAEGMAISVFQSIKNGLLPIITPVGEIPNYTEDGINAIYFDSSNIKKSASYFYNYYLSDFHNFKIGFIKNKNNYPTFSENFFNSIDEIVEELKKNPNKE